MKIAVVVHTFPVFSETFVINHVVSLIESGHDVTVFSFNAKPSITVRHPQFFQYMLEGRTVYGQSLPGKMKTRLLRFAKLICRNIFVQRNFKPLKTLNIFRFGKSALGLKMFFQSQLFLFNNEFDIVHCHYGNVGNDIQELQQAGLIKGKLVVSFHGFELRDESIIKKNKGYKTVFKQSEYIVANSSYTANQLALLGCPAEKLVILPVTPNVDLFQQKSKTLQAKKKAFHVLTIARLEEVKGLEYGIKAILILRNKHQLKIVWNIVGDGALMQHLSALVKSAGLEDAVIFHGAKSQAELPHFLSEADVFLLPSLMETQGLVLIEAQMMGLPVVASNVGGIPDSMRNGKTGFLVEEKNPEQIAAALYQLFRDDVLRKEFGEMAVQFVSENFDPSLVTRRMNAVYTQALEAVA